MILPSKKVLSVFILIAALVVAIIVAFGRDKSSQAINFASDIVAGDKILVPENPNWQDELSGVATNIKLAQTETSTSTKETATDTISRTLISNYLALKQNGNLNSTSAQELVDKTISYIGESGGRVAEIFESQLNIVADNGKQSITDYGENLGNISIRNKPLGTKNEIGVIMKVVQSQDSSQINELSDIIATYKKITGELIQMPVPKTFVRAHIDLVNGVGGIAQALIEIKNVSNDPVSGLVALQIYVKNATLLASVKKAVVDFISQNNISYKQNSGGYYLLYGI